MAFVTRFLLYLVLILLLITGCSGKGNPSAPDTLDDPTEPLNLTETRELTEYSGSHFPLFHNLIYMDVTDPGNVEYEVVPLLLKAKLCLLEQTAELKFTISGDLSR